MMGEVVLPQILWFGIMGEGGNSAGLMSGLAWILPLFLGLLGSCLALQCQHFMQVFRFSGT